jgi:hypothetical protein
MMNHRIPFHTTFSRETLKYIEEKHELMGISKGAVVDWLVEQQKKRDNGREEQIIKEITQIVLKEYYKKELLL